MTPEELEAKLDKSGDCWIWRGSTNKWGYGIFTAKGKLKFVHRVMWETANKRSAHGWVVLHACDNPRCGNPAHLSLGTARDNRADCVRKGRHAKGESMAGAKLTEDGVRAIRTIYACGGITQKQLAAIYGVCHNTILKVINRQYWRHVE